MADGYPIDGKPKGREPEMHPEIKKGYIAFAAIVIVAAVVIGYFAFAGQAPVQTTTDTGGGMMGNGKVQPAENPAINTAATGAVVIPADALVMITGSGEYSPKYSIDGYPKNIYLKDMNVLIKDIKITSTAITGTAVDIKTGKIPGMMAWAVGFEKEGETIGSVSIDSSYPFKADRKPETLGADKVFFSFG